MPNRVSPSALNINNYLQLLDACTASKSLKNGKTLHQHLLKLNAAQPSVLAKLTRLYISCGRHHLAHRVFDSIPTPHKRNNTTLWNQLIRAYAWDGPFEAAVRLYDEMLDSGINPTNYTYPFVLKACSASLDVSTGVRVHRHAKMANLDKDIYVCTALVDFYLKCGLLPEANQMFDEMPERDVVAWNAMVSGFSSHGMYWDAIRLLSEMQMSGTEPNSSTFAAILPVIGEKSKLREGKSIHGFCLRRGLDVDVVVGTGLLDMYGKCGLLIYSRRIFDSLKTTRNEVTWSAIIGACITCGSTRESFELFEEMRMDTSKSLLSLSSALISTLVRGCAKVNDLNLGMQLHCYTIISGFSPGSLMVSNTLLSMYAKCGLIIEAMRLFEEMRVKDSVSYSAIISGYVQNGYAEEALRMFRKMQLAGVYPEVSTMMGFFPACSNLAALQLGVCGHGYSVTRGFTSDISLCNALIDMYGKCGKMEEARLVFDKMDLKDVVSWNTMLVSYGIHGLGKEAILLFQDMVDISQRPDEVTFIALISACSHSGLVNEGKFLFKRMSKEFDISPNLDHYFCMVDMLGRAGLLDEAYRLVKTMPFKPDSHLWNSLLASCKTHKDIGLGEEVSNEIQSLGHSSTGNFVLLFNLYATAQRWDDAANVRVNQNELGFKKKPGCSWIEVDGSVHAFVGGDVSHLQSSEIYKKLEELAVEMKRLGYFADPGFVYHDVEEEEKEKILLYHSEKLAVAYGIISLRSDKPILVTKNLRVCGDCHTALKLITVIAKREITVRDTSRFHHFKNGVCSCGEFW